MGMRTIRAVKQLQKDSRLPMTGGLDKETVDRLVIAKMSK
jgi:Putative peptidoglycan binding domain